MTNKWSYQKYTVTKQVKNRKKKMINLFQSGRTDVRQYQRN